MTELQTIQAWLQSSYSVQVPPDWLAACVEWIQQESGGQPVGLGQLQTLVFEQWLMSDLRELGASCLPPDLPSHQHTQITGQFALQVESMLNVGVPLYGQLQKVKGTLNENSEVSADHPQQPAWEPKPSRMMLLKMTDGQTEVTGMEYRPIPDLNANLHPGFKVVVRGQLTCRRGVLMLTADNLQVLGGEVDSLMEANTPVAWEDDLDYGGILEEPMDEQSTLPTVPMQTVYPQNPKPMFRNNLSSSSFHSSAAPLGTNSRPEKPQSREALSARIKNERSSDVGNVNTAVSHSQQSNGLGIGKSEPLPQTVVKTEASVFEDSVWDDDEFAFDEDGFMSPVIPVQVPLSKGQIPSTTKSLPSSVVSHAETRNALNGWNQQSNPPFGTKTADKASPSSSVPTRANSVSSQLSTAKVKSQNRSSQLTLDSLLQKSSSTSMLGSSPKSAPPPAKQRKLTSMLSTYHRDTTNSGSSDEPIQISGNKNGDILDCRIVVEPARTLSNDVNDRDGPKAAHNSVINRPDTTQEPKTHTARNIFEQNGHSVNGSNVLKGDNPLNPVTNIPKEAAAVAVPGDACEPEEEPSKNHSLQDVRGWLTTHTEGEALFTVKGYITTLTDRLRSGSGYLWTLSCRITDGVTTMDVALADCVLTRLIGFTAKECVTLKQQARKDLKIKEVLSEGIQKCQRGLEEFSGLMDVKTKGGENKPFLINM
ncbi:hypothetical protein BaRGS_00011535, partial [Batillaria attramentaria]